MFRSFSSRIRVGTRQGKYQLCPVALLYTEDTWVRSLLLRSRSTSLSLFFLLQASDLPSKLGPEWKDDDTHIYSDSVSFSITSFKCCGWKTVNVEQTNLAWKEKCQHKVYSCPVRSLQVCAWWIKGQSDPVPARDERLEGAQVTVGEKVSVSEWKRYRGGDKDVKRVLVYAFKQSWSDPVQAQTLAQIRLTLFR